MPIATRSFISVERIRFLFDYNPMTGEFRHRYRRMNIIFGKSLRCDGEHHELSRYIWVHFHGYWPPLDKVVEHRNRNRKDNKIMNLRLATSRQNSFNFKHYNPHGYKGITYNYGRPMKPWLAQIRIAGKKVNLGRYETKEEAAEAYAMVARNYHGEFLCL